MESTVGEINAAVVKLLRFSALTVDTDSRLSLDAFRHMIVDAFGLREICLAKRIDGDDYDVVDNTQTLATCTHVEAVSLLRTDFVNILTRRLLSCSDVSSPPMSAKYRY